MAAEKKLLEILRQEGLEPVEGRCIVVKYAPNNLSARIAQFFSMEFYALQLCREALALVPFSALTANLRREVALCLPYAQIRGVKVSEDLLNYRIDIDTQEGRVSLTAQQKELSSLRSSGMLSAEGLLHVSLWHQENLDLTLQALEALGAENSERSEAK